MDLKNKTVMVVGTGISGIGAVDLLNKVGAYCMMAMKSLTDRRCRRS